MITTKEKEIRSQGQMINKGGVPSDICLSLLCSLIIERMSKINTHTHTHTHIYIYIYM